MPGPESLEVRRERVVQALCAHFARDRLTMEDLEARLEHAQQAQSDLELTALVADLPSLDLDVARVPTPQPSPQSSPFFALARPGDRPPPRRMFALFSNIEREGPWTVPERVEVSAIFGSVKVDLAGASLQAGLTTIVVTSIFGDVRIIVPPGVRVESDGDAVFGNFEHKYMPDDAIADDAPVVRVTGKAVFGSVTIKTWVPKKKALEKLRAQWKAIGGEPK